MPSVRRMWRRRDLPNAASARRFQRDPADERPVGSANKRRVISLHRNYSGSRASRVWQRLRWSARTEHKMGDNHFRVTSTDFTPGVQSTKGISLSQWVPIVTMSGPIRKGKMWFIDALDGEYDNNITKQLPSGHTDHVWRADNLAKLQSNLTTRNIVTLSFLSNYYHDEYAGLSVLHASADDSNRRRDRLYRLAQRPILFSRRRAARDRIRRGPVQRGVHSAGKCFVHSDDAGSRRQLLPA